MRQEKIYVIFINNAIFINKEINIENYNMQ